MVQQDGLDGVEQGVEADIAGLKGWVDFISLHIVELSEGGDE